MSSLWDVIDETKIDMVNQRHKRALDASEKEFKKIERKKPNKKTMVRFPEITEHNILIFPEEETTAIKPKRKLAVVSSIIMSLALGVCPSFQQPVESFREDVKIQEVKTSVDRQWSRHNEDVVLDKIKEVQKLLDGINSHEKR